MSTLATLDTILISLCGKPLQGFITEAIEESKPKLKPYLALCKIKKGAGKGRYKKRVVWS